MKKVRTVIIAISAAIIGAYGGNRLYYYLVPTGLDRFAGSWVRAGDPSHQIEITRSGDVFTITYHPQQTVRGMSMPEKLTAKPVVYDKSGRDIAVDGSYGPPAANSVFSVGSSQLIDGTTGWTYERK
jgi:hypothetical protein